MQITTQKIHLAFSLERKHVLTWSRDRCLIRTSTAFHRIFLRNTHTHTHRTHTDTETQQSERLKLTNRPFYTLHWPNCPKCLLISIKVNVLFVSRRHLKKKQKTNALHRPLWRLASDCNWTGNGLAVTTGTHGGRRQCHLAAARRTTWWDQPQRFVTRLTWIRDNSSCQLRFEYLLIKYLI